jgi:propanol-preferring alcohol dehydrogenase
MAVQILRAVTAARVVAVSRSEDRLRLARELGADEGVLQDVVAPAAIRELTGGAGADVVLDCVGSDETLALAAAIVATGGDIQIIGAGGGTLTLGQSALTPLPLETRIIRPFWGTRAELFEVIELAQAGRIEARIEQFPLDRVEEAYARLAAGEIDGRAVVVP